eukprot:7584577-Pyramimonas_sp.AAC.1
MTGRAASGISPTALLPARYIPDFWGSSTWPRLRADALMRLDRRRQGECAVVERAASAHAMHRVRNGRPRGALALQDVGGAVDGCAREA